MTIDKQQSIISNIEGIQAIQDMKNNKSNIIIDLASNDQTDTRSLLKANSLLSWEIYDDKNYNAQESVYENIVRHKNLSKSDEFTLTGRIPVLGKTSLRPTNKKFISKKLPPKQSKYLMPIIVISCDKNTEIIRYENGEIILKNVSILIKNGHVSEKADENSITITGDGRAYILSLK